LVNNQFYKRGQQDCLQRLPANPANSGAENPTHYNDYMNGYNSTREMVQRDLHSDFGGSTRSFKRILNIDRQPSLFEEICVQSLEFSLNAIRKEKKFDAFLTDSERFFTLAFSTLYSLNPQIAIGYAGKYNTLQLKKMGPEDLARSAGKLISLIGESPEKPRGTSFPEISDFFTDVLLNVISKGNYTPQIILPDEFYLKFIQALAMENNQSLTRFKVSAFNETQKAMANHSKRKVKKIVEIGSRLRYGISLGE
jgi:hypothetical protein